MFSIELYYFCTSRKRKKRRGEEIKFVDISTLHLEIVMFNN